MMPTRKNVSKQPLSATQVYRSGELGGIYFGGIEHARDRLEEACRLLQEWQVSGLGQHDFEGAALPDGGDGAASIER
jgi:hypothetical protein